jgi:hypothetical protein
MSPASNCCGLDSIASHTGFVVNKMALGRVFSQYFGFPCWFSFHQVLHVHQSSYLQSSIVSILIASLNNKLKNIILILCSHSLTSLCTLVSIVTCRGLCMSNNNGFWIGRLDLLALLVQLNSITITVHNRWLPQARSVSSWTTSVFFSTVAGYLINSCGCLISPGWILTTPFHDGFVSTTDSFLWVWVWVSYYDRRSVGQSVLE